MDYVTPIGVKPFSGKTIEWWHEILAKCASPKDVVAALGQTNHGERRHQHGLRKSAEPVNFTLGIT
jgi:hypothetical protein